MKLSARTMSERTATKKRDDILNINTIRVLWRHTSAHDTFTNAAYQTPKQGVNLLSILPIKLLSCLPYPGRQLFESLKPIIKEYLTS